MQYFFSEKQSRNSWKQMKSYPHESILDNLLASNKKELSFINVESFAKD